MACAVFLRSASGRCRRSSPARTRSDPSPCGSRRRPDWRDGAPSARAATAPCRPRRFPGSGGMFGGGGCGGTPSRLVRIHLPRSTGDVRFGYEVTVRMLAWPSSPRRASFGDLHAPEPAAVDVGNAVMPRQPLVDERVVGVQQIHHAAVLAHDAVEEQRRSLPSSPAGGCRRSPGRRRDPGLEFFRLRRCSHCSAKLAIERLRSRIGQHAPDLLLEHRRLLQLALARQRQQLLVGKAAPQKERQPRRQREVVQPIRRVRRKVRRIGLDAEQELRAREDELQRRLDAAIEVAAALRARARRSPSACRAVARSTGLRYACRASVDRICRAHAVFLRRRRRACR